MGRPPVAVLGFAVLLTAVAACTPAGTVVSSPTPSPVKHTVVDGAPYVCNFIPRSEVGALTAYSGTITAGPNTRHSVGSTCVVSNDKQGLLITSYQTSAGQETIENYIHNGEQEGRVPLPAALGVGEMSSDKVDGYPFRRAGAWFRCGATSPLITLQVKTNPARDQDHDLVQLVKIAERRFGEMFGCEPSSDPR